MIADIQEHADKVENALAEMDEIVERMAERDRARARPPVHFVRALHQLEALLGDLVQQGYHHADVWFALGYVSGLPRDYAERFEQGRAYAIAYDALREIDEWTEEHDED